MADATRTVQIVLKVVDQATKSIKATNALFKEIGYKPNLDNDEIQAYMTCFTCEIIDSHIKEHKREIKKI